MSWPHAPVHHQGHQLFIPIFLPTYLGYGMWAQWMISCRPPDLSRQSFPFTRVSPLSSFGHILTHQTTVVDQQSVSDLALYAQPPAWIDLLSGHGLVPMPPRSTDQCAHQYQLADRSLGPGLTTIWAPELAMHSLPLAGVIALSSNRQVPSCPGAVLQ